MREFVAAPPVRLGSVALRYRCPLVANHRSPSRALLGGVEPHTGAKSSGNEGGNDALGVREPRMAQVEAVLFLAREPLNTRRLAQLANLADGTEARTLIGRLNRMFDQRQTAYRAEEVAGGFQLLSRPKYGAWLRRLHQTPVETRLSSPAMETLAVVAYRQPVLRAEIESIRGVQCGEMLRQLMERELVRIAGRSDELGRPFLYGTTKRFLQVFGLRHLDELPRAEMLRLRPEENSPSTIQVTDTVANQAVYTADGHEEEQAVTVALDSSLENEVEETPGAIAVGFQVVADVAPEHDSIDDDDDVEDEEEDDDEEDEEDEDYEDYDEEFDEEDDDEWEDDDDEEDEDEDDDEDEWEEVDDDDEEEEDDDEEDEDWDNEDEEDDEEEDDEEEEDD